jgi:SEC-C motif-containing protein
MKDEKCPCGSDKKYKECCGLVHQDMVYAKTAEDLMRARYTAFVLADGDFLIESFHADTKKPEMKEQLVAWAKSMEWIGLDILRTRQGQEGDEEGVVEFKAHFKEGRKIRVLQQRSKFVREFGSWRYHSEA